MNAATFGPNGLTATTLGVGGEAAGEGDAFVAFLDAALHFPNEISIPADEYYRLSFTLDYLTGKDLPGRSRSATTGGVLPRHLALSRPRTGGSFSETVPIVMLDGGRRPSRWTCAR